MRAPQAIAVTLWTLCACAPPPPSPEREPEPPAASIEPALPAPETTALGPAPPPELPADLRVTLEAHAHCSRQSCARGVLYPFAVPPAGGAPAAMWSQSIEPGGELELAAEALVDLYGVVVSGTATIESTLGTASRRRLPRWHAFHAPAAGVRLGAIEPSHLVLALATGGNSVQTALSHARLENPPLVRPRAISLIDLAAREQLSWAGGKAHARLGFESGRASFGLLMASADAPVPEHDHPSSWEVIALLRGDGTFRRGAAPGEPLGRAQPVRSGSIVAVPRGVRHAFEPSGKQELFAVQLYLPPGPEQRFKDLARQPAPR